MDSIENIEKIKEEELEKFTAYITSMKRLNFIKKLGAGAFSTVWEVLFQNGNYMAYKIINNYNSNKEKCREKSLMNEINLSINLKHPNIIKTFQFNTHTIENFTFHGWLMEQAQYSTLAKLIHYYKTPDFYSTNLFQKQYKYMFRTSEYVLRYLAKQILMGLEYMHRIGIVHYDIKPDNIWIFAGFIPKLSDFSVTQSIGVGKNGETMIPRAGTRGYMAPELFDKQKVQYSEINKIDIFSFGAMFYYMIFGENMIKVQKGENLTVEEIQEKVEKAKEKIENEYIEKKKSTEIKVSKKDEVNTIKKESNEVKGDCLTFFSKSIANIKDRASCKELLDDKWWNEGSEVINDVFNWNEEDPKKTFLELHKREHLEERKRHRINKRDKIKMFFRR